MYVKGFINTHIRKQKQKNFKCTHTYDAYGIRNTHNILAYSSYA